MNSSTKITLLNVVHAVRFNIEPSHHVAVTLGSRFLLYLRSMKMPNNCLFLSFPALMDNAPPNITPIVLLSLPPIRYGIPNLCDNKRFEGIVDSYYLNNRLNFFVLVENFYF